MKIKTIFVLILLVSLGFGVYSVSFSADASTQLGTVEDPLVTKSYVDNILNQLGSKGTINIDQEQVKKLVTEEIAKQKPSTGENTSSTTNLQIIQIQPTQTLYGGSGTEFIVRTGKVQVTSSDESGIADVTSGKDITAGQAVELNHLLIVPREGRGIKPDPKNKQEIFVMVRGGYSILNADGTMATP